MITASSQSEKGPRIAAFSLARHLSARDEYPILHLDQVSEPELYEKRTTLYDAVYLGLERITRGNHKKRAFVIVSDGHDNSSGFSYSEMRRYLKDYGSSPVPPGDHIGHRRQVNILIPRRGAYMIRPVDLDS